MSCRLEGPCLPQHDGVTTQKTEIYFKERIAGHVNAIIDASTDLLRSYLRRRNATKDNI